jgi:predicted ester cyclase
MAEVAYDLFAPDHRFDDPQVRTADGPDGVIAAVRTYQDAVGAHWDIQELFSAGDEVVVRWIGSGTHVGEIDGIAPTGRPIRVDAITIHTVKDGRITWTREVWDTLGFLQQLGVVPGPA